MGEAQKDQVCWCQTLGGVGWCVPGFQPIPGPLKNKFCEECRSEGLRIPASRLRVLTSQAPKGILRNSKASSVWSSGATLDGYRFDFRLVNNNHKVAGAGSKPVIVFREEPPKPSQMKLPEGFDGAAGSGAFMDGWPDAWLTQCPNEWVVDGYVPMAVTHATLTPMSGKKYNRKRQFSEALAALQHISPLPDFPELWGIGGGSKTSSDNTSEDVSSSDERSSPPHFPTGANSACDFESAFTAWGLRAVPEDHYSPASNAISPFDVFPTLAPVVKEELTGFPELAYPLPYSEEEPVKYLQIAVMPATAREAVLKPGVVVAHAFSADPDPSDLYMDSIACLSLPPSPPEAPAAAVGPPTTGTSPVATAGGGSKGVQWEMLIVFVACTHVVGGLIFLTMSSSLETPDPSVVQNDTSWHSFTAWSQHQFNPPAPSFRQGLQRGPGGDSLVVISLYLLPLLISVASSISWNGFRSRQIEQVVMSPLARKCVAFTLLLRSFHAAHNADCVELSTQAGFGSYPEFTKCALPAFSALNALWAFVSLALLVTRLRATIGRWLCIDALARLVSLGASDLLHVHLDQHTMPSMTASLLFWIVVFVGGATLDMPACGAKYVDAKSG